MFCSGLTCAMILILSRGAVIVLDTTPATPPARRARQITNEAGGICWGARSLPAKLEHAKLYLAIKLASGYSADVE